MPNINSSYEKDLDLNLLRVFVVVAEAGSVTEAARRLYLTQPAVSAALQRLSRAVGAPLFARQGRGLGLTARGQRLFAVARPHLTQLVAAARSPLAFDPRTSDRTITIGLSDANERWLLPRLLAVLAREAPRMRLVVLPVQFRTVGAALEANAIDFAVVVADDLPAGTRRRTLFRGGFVCLFDPRYSALARKRITLSRYLQQEHVIVSYNGDLRGVVEDLLGVQRSVRVSVPTFHSVGAVVAGSALVATVPEMVARELVAMNPELRTSATPFDFPGAGMELVSRTVLDDDEAVRFVEAHVARIATEAFGDASARPPGAGTRSRRGPGTSVAAAAPPAPRAASGRRRSQHRSDADARPPPAPRHRGR